ncbi:adenylosuccinate synthetase [Micromonospora echinospora]|uniref:Adenylosuccinate synthetase n=1 Tax=Micromonospora echinospora TaxID=1877 RepID=A0A1C4W388_MICEC|nr:adenylosuccinate synthetase [Micromonospora echinospora]OZV80100.1 adenylosuccinate synthetase [Micromonospora echinospora]SCE90625.1 adenylosuccinate synthase [Micromonospora echinospora]
MNHMVVVDLGYGDAGKGTVVDWLCATRPVHTVVRFNGGAQAAHNVVLADGRQHTFAQLGAGTFRPGVRTHLSRHVVVDPLALAAEADHLTSVGVPDALDRLTVDGEALLATPYHRAANRARELARGADRHGSCGLGVGETVAYGLAHPDEAPRVADCRHPELLRDRLTRLRDRLTAELGPLDAPPVEDCLPAFTGFAARVAIVDGSYLAGVLRAGTCVFEGAQGVLLDEWHGFHPYTTWSTTTFANAEELLAEAGLAGTARRLGVLRTVTTRHGPGPLVTEDRELPLTDPRNPTNPWQGRFRFGHFDAVAHRYALEVAGGVDGLALTHLDLADQGLRICHRYDTLDRLPVGPPGDLDRQAALTERLLSAQPVYDDPPADWVPAVEEALAAPVVLTSHGPTAEDKRPASPAPPFGAGWRGSAEVGDHLVVATG